LWIKGQIGKGVKWIDEEFWPLIKQGIIKGFSYGYKIQESEQQQIGDKVVNVLKKVELLEISIVTIPMNRGTLLTRNL
jgi:HK97 family phage prohead protease